MACEPRLITDQRQDSPALYFLLLPGLATAILIGANAASDTWWLAFVLAVLAGRSSLRSLRRSSSRTSTARRRSTRRRESVARRSRPNHGRTAAVADLRAEVEVVACASSLRRHDRPDGISSSRGKHRDLVRPLDSRDGKTVVRVSAVTNTGLEDAAGAAKYLRDRERQARLRGLRARPEKGLVGFWQTPLGDYLQRKELPRSAPSAFGRRRVRRQDQARFGAPLFKGSRDDRDLETLAARPRLHAAHRCGTRSEAIRVEHLSSVSRSSRTS